MKELREDKETRRGGDKDRADKETGRGGDKECFTAAKPPSHLLVSLSPLLLVFFHWRVWQEPQVGPWKRA
jgi:hypothetical protein